MADIIEGKIQMQWTLVGLEADIPLQGARRVETNNGPIGVFKTLKGELFALKDACPHKHGPLTEGIIHGNAVACPLHNWSISLETGEALGADAGKGCTPKIPLKIEDGKIYLSLNS